MTHPSNAREFDIIVFGATSFVGKLTAQYLVDTHPELAIAVAGRNESKLQELAHTSGIKLPILVADASRIDELRELTAR
ncbi:saccharopine dehydrogenase NADP-binding domain-containing protein [Corynebacterium stationis]|nr:saccharopine dehydrogenase NADP-binding domain-containing protein [Corynebacterium stationis]